MKIIVRANDSRRKTRFGSEFWQLVLVSLYNVTTGIAPFCPDFLSIP